MLEIKGQKGISGRAFLLMVGGFLTAMFCVGLLLAPDDVKVILGATISSFLLKYGLKVLAWAVWSYGVTWVFIHNVLDTNWKELLERFNRAHNDSHAILFAAILLTGALVMSLSTGVTARAYFYIVCTKGSIGLALATLLTVVTARAFGIQSMDEFRDWVDASDNDSHAILVSVVWIASVIMAMTV